MNQKVLPRLIMEKTILKLSIELTSNSQDGSTHSVLLMMEQTMTSSSLNSNTTNPKDQPKLTMVRLKKLSSIEKPTLLMAKNSADGQIHSVGLIAVMMMIPFYEKAKVSEIRKWKRVFFD